MIRQLSSVPSATSKSPTWSLDATGLGRDFALRSVRGHFGRRELGLRHEAEELLRRGAPFLQMPRSAARQSGVLVVAPMKH